MLTMILVGGDFMKGDGTGSFSIYGDKFPVSLNMEIMHPFTPSDLHDSLLG